MLVITLLSLMLIGALVFYVFNTGRQLQRRIAVQNAADATAISGAGWLARSLNVVAMDNVAMARQIAFVDVLDATDEALQPAYAQTHALHRALIEQEPDSAGAFSGNEVSFLDGQFKPVIGAYGHDLAVLEPMKRLFRAPKSPASYATPSGPIDVKAYTFVNGPKWRGRLWQSIMSLEGLSLSVMEHVETRMRQAATRMGRADVRSGGVMLLPGAVGVPWHRGVWQDFRRPVSMGRLPKFEDDARTNRGPWDTIFGWRQRVFEWRLTRIGVWHPGGRSVGSGPSGPGGLGPGEHTSGYWDPLPQREKVAAGYEDIGPQSWMLEKLRFGDLKVSPFYQWRDLFAKWKLDDAFNADAQHSYAKPVWLTDWGKIAGTAGSGAIQSTAMFIVRVESDVPADSGSYLSSGTYRVARSGQVVMRGGDWRVPTSPCDRATNDPRAWEKKLEAWRKDCPAFKKLSPLLQSEWKNARYVQLGAQTWRFGSPIQRDGRMIWQYIYYTVLGVNVGEPVPVRNPFNFGSHEQRPAPIELDQNVAGVSQPGARRAYFTVLGVAEANGASPMWPRRFDAGRVFGNSVAVAQARVFNNHSWDLWTQMWHAQLEPVTGYGGWVAAAQAAPASTWSGSGLSADQAAGLRGYLERTRQLAQVLLRH